MKIPENVNLYEHTIGTLWFDANGILHSVSKTAPRSMEIMTEYVAYMKQILNNQRVFILSDISDAVAMDKATRDYMDTELGNLYKAMALVSHKAAGKMIGNVFMTLNTPNLPIRMFLNEKDGEVWLLELIKQENEQ